MINNRQPHCLLNRLFRQTTKHQGPTFPALCEENSPVTGGIPSQFVRGIHLSPVVYPPKGPVMRKAFSMSWSFRVDSSEYLIRYVSQEIITNLLSCTNSRYHSKLMTSLITHPNILYHHDHVYIFYRIGADIFLRKLYRQWVITIRLADKMQTFDFL